MNVCVGLWVSGGDTFLSLNKGAECYISLGQKFSILISEEIAIIAQLLPRKK